VDNIKMDLEEIGCDGGEGIWSALQMGPVMGSSEHGNEPSGSIKGRKFLD
jgi:hypothetical protein